MYRYQAKLVYKQYIPKQLELGMLFIMFVEGKPQFIEYQNLFFDMEMMVMTYGYPVEMYIVEEEDYNDTIAEPQDIGWFDDEDCDDLREFTLKEANHILMEYDGLLEVQIDEDLFDQDEQVVPAYVLQKVIVNYIEEDVESI